MTARAREDDGEFVVLKGSHARRDGTDSWTFGKKDRAKLLEDGMLVPAADGDLAFAEDVAFSSPSLAAAVVLARNTNGRTAWKLRGSGQTYADWQETKLDEAAASAGLDPEMDEATEATEERSS
ncbi:MAG: DUF4357 domain-containing protein [Phycisphaerales bacterium]